MSMLVDITIGIRDRAGVPILLRDPQNFAWLENRWVGRCLDKHGTNRWEWRDIFVILIILVVIKIKTAIIVKIEGVASTKMRV